MSNFVDITTYTIENESAFLLDANVLLYLFYTSGNYKKSIIRKYALFYADIVKHEGKIVLPLTLLSEFTNRFYRLEYSDYLENRQLKSSTFNFKMFRDTAEFGIATKDISDIINLQILPYSEKVNYIFTECNIESLIQNSNCLDMNDSIYYDIAKKRGIPIVTHDGDFAHISDVSIITANARILTPKQL